MPTTEPKDLEIAKSIYLHGTLLYADKRFQLEFYDRLRRRTLRFRLGVQEQAMKVLRAIDAESEHGGAEDTVDAAEKTLEVRVRFSPGKFMKRFFPSAPGKEEKKILRFSDVIEEFFVSGCYRELVETVQRAVHAGVMEEKFSGGLAQAAKVVADEAAKMIRTRLERDLSAAPEVQAMFHAAAEPPPILDRSGQVRLYVEHTKTGRIHLFVPYEVLVKKKPQHLILADAEDHTRLLRVDDHKRFKSIADVQDVVSDRHTGDEVFIEEKSGSHAGHIVQIVGV